MLNDVHWLASMQLAIKSNIWVMKSVILGSYPPTRRGRTNATLAGLRSAPNEREVYIYIYLGSWDDRHFQQPWWPSPLIYIYESERLLTWSQSYYRLEEFWARRANLCNSFLKLIHDVIGTFNIWESKTRQSMNIDDLRRKKYSWMNLENHKFDVGLVSGNKRRGTVSIAGYRGVNFSGRHLLDELSDTA